MSENYKKEIYFKIPSSTITTNGELYDFIRDNINLTDDELLTIVKKYVSYGTDNDYLLKKIRVFKRKYKINKLLNEKDDV